MSAVLQPLLKRVKTVESTFWSEVGNVCFGIGGSPGESVYMKTGATELEPKQADYYMNIDIGSQSQGGNNALVIGNIAVEGLSCDGGKFEAKEVVLTAEQSFEIITSPQGKVWVFIGSDSGYEGLTHLYYEFITVTFDPA